MAGYINKDAEWGLCSAVRTENGLIMLFSVETEGEKGAVQAEDVEKAVRLLDFCGESMIAAIKEGLEKKAAALRAEEI
jgi:hypothetical protein